MAVGIRDPGPDRRLWVAGAIALLCAACGSIEVSWQVVPGATQYRVYRDGETTARGTVGAVTV